jgi:hypothetical protein
VLIERNKTHTKNTKAAEATTTTTRTKRSLFRP